MSAQGAEQPPSPSDGGIPCQSRGFRVACLQFAPKLGQVQENMDKAERLLEDVEDQINWLLLPEMAFTGKSADFPKLSEMAREKDPSKRSILFKTILGLLLGNGELLLSFLGYFNQHRPIARWREKIQT